MHADFIFAVLEPEYELQKGAKKLFWWVNEYWDRKNVLGVNLYDPMVSLLHSGFCWRGIFR